MEKKKADEVGRPLVGGFVTDAKDYHWTQHVLLVPALLTLLITIPTQETFHPLLVRALLEKHHHAHFTTHIPPLPPLGAQIHAFVSKGIARPVHMLLTEPIVLLTSLHVALEFATLFSFFAAVPYVFASVYAFSVPEVGMVFIALVLGVVGGVVTVALVNSLLYVPRTRHLSAVPPEYRLYSSMIGSVGLPVGLFVFGWTARADVHWAVPAAAIVVFSWANICLFLGVLQYITDTYVGGNVASASSANSLARYLFAGLLMLVTVRSKSLPRFGSVLTRVVYEAMGVGWASSLLGFLALIMLPVPFLFFKFGKKIRAKSTYETVQY